MFKTNEIRKLPEKSYARKAWLRDMPHYAGFPDIHQLNKLYYKIYYARSTFRLSSLAWLTNDSLITRKL